MIVTLNKWFRLPQLGRDVFSDLMKARVKYDSKFGFQFTSATNVPRAILILSSALNENVELAKTCFICEKPIGDKEQNDSTICSECLRDENAFDMYVMKFAKLMESV